MGFVNFLTYIKHLGEKALVFFPSKTDLISITDKNGVTEELLSERLETINNKIEKQNILKNVEQYTKENPLIFKAGEIKDFSTTASLKAGKYYSFSFEYEGEVFEQDEVGLIINDNDDFDAIDFINSSTIFFDDFYFKPKLTGEYTFFWNRLDTGDVKSKLLRVYNLKIVEGYSPEMVKTVEEIKKLDKSKLKNVDNTHDKDKYVKGVIDQGGDGKQNIRFYYQNMNNVVTTASWFPAFSSSGADAGSTVIKPISKENLINTLGVNDKQNITNGIVTGDVDWNTLTTAGAYKIQNCNMTEVNHAPVGEFAYGSLFVIVSQIGGEKRTIQLYFPSHNNNNAILGHKCSVRALNTYNNADMWSIWYKFLTEDNGVKKSGDTMTGGLTVPTVFANEIRATGGIQACITCLRYDNSGDAVIVDGGALTMIGSGESAINLKSNLTLANNSEEMYISSDNNIHFYTNCQNITNKKHAYIDQFSLYHGRGLWMEESTATFLNGVVGLAGVNSLNNTGFNCLAAGRTIAGRFGLATYESGTSSAPQGGMEVYYIEESDVTNSNNAVKYRARLLTDKGNTVFPGNVIAQSFTGAIKDAGVTKHDLYLNFSDAGLETADWLCAWHARSQGGHEIRALHKDKLKSLLGMPFQDTGIATHKSSTIWDNTVEVDIKIKHLCDNMYVAVGYIDARNVTKAIGFGSTIIDNINIRLSYQQYSQTYKNLGVEFVFVIQTIAGSSNISIEVENGTKDSFIMGILPVFFPFYYVP